jgi:hypothetical protein
MVIVVTAAVVIVKRTRYQPLPTFSTVAVLFVKVLGVGEVTTPLCVK